MKKFFFQNSMWFILLLFAGVIFAEEAVQGKLKALLQRPQSVQDRITDESERMLLLAEAKKYVTNCPPTERGRVTFLLIELGDQKAISEVVHEYQTTARIGDRNSMIRMLKGSSRLEIVPSLASDLTRDEPPDMVREGSFFSDPASVRAARIIRAVVMNSAAVPVETKQWVSELGRDTPDVLRANIRKFWETNRNRFAQKEYSQIQVPVNNGKD